MRLEIICLVSEDIKIQGPRHHGRFWLSCQSIEGTSNVVFFKG